jgi:small subunit ribosomal protein S17
MADEENKDAVEETQQDEAQQDAGPVAEEASSSQTTGGDAPSPPPASDAPEADASGDDSGDQATESAPEAEQPKDDAPADSGPAAGGGGAGEDDDTPWKARRRLEKSRLPHEAGPALTVEERAAKRLAERKAAASVRRKTRAAANAKRQPGTGTPVADRKANAAKVRQGIVVSDKGEKTITVRIDIVRRHPTYEKVVRRSRTLHAHDEANQAAEGDVVRVVETRPMSKTKRWRLVDVVEKAR